MDKMFAIIKVVALFVVVVVAVSSHPMSGEKKDFSHHEAAVLPTDKTVMRHSISWFEGIQNVQRDDDAPTEPPPDPAPAPAPAPAPTPAPGPAPAAGSTTANPSVTTTASPNSTTESGSFPIKPSSSITTVLLFSMLIIVPGVFFGMC